MNGNLIPDPINGHTSMAGAMTDCPASRRPDRLLAGVRQFPEDRTNLWSPCSNCSSDENNSPTTLNTFNWDKPALEDKTVDFGWSPATTTRTNGRSPQSKDVFKRPASSKEKGGSYANLHRAGANTSQEYKASENKHSPKKEHQLRQGCGSVSECSLTENLYPTVERKGKSTNPFVESSSDSPRDTEDEYYERSEEDIVREREDLRNVAWFQAGIPREIALEVLSEKSEGAFIVRQSTTKPGCYALSLRVPRSKNPSGIAHYLILRTNKGYKIKGFTKEFSSLSALITHHSVMPELLPCTLDLSRPSVRDAEREFAETEQKACDIFSDIHWLMTES